MLEEITAGLPFEMRKQHVCAASCRAEEHNPSCDASSAREGERTLGTAVGLSWLLPHRSRPSSEVNEFLDLFDMDQNGMISRDEFLNFAKVAFLFFARRV